MKSWKNENLIKSLKENYVDDSFNDFKRMVNTLRIALEEGEKIEFLGHTIEYSFRDNSPTGYLLVDGKSQHRSWDDGVKRVFQDIAYDELENIFQNGPND